MEGLKARMADALQQPEWAERWQAATGGTPQQCPPIYSFDNPHTHTGNKTYLRALGLVGAKWEPTAAWLELPAYSGDLHRTIERVHARVCGQFQQWLDGESGTRNMDFYVRKLADVFNSSQTPKLISKCMWGRHPLPELYSAVIAVAGAKVGRPYC